MPQALVRPVVHTGQVKNESWKAVRSRQGAELPDHLVYRSTADRQVKLDIRNAAWRWVASLTELYHT